MGRRRHVCAGAQERDVRGRSDVSAQLRRGGRRAGGGRRVGHAVRAGRGLRLRAGRDARAARRGDAGAAQHVHDRAAREPAHQRDALPRRARRARRPSSDAHGPLGERHLRQRRARRPQLQHAAPRRRRRLCPPPQRPRRIFSLRCQGSFPVPISKKATEATSTSVTTSATTTNKNTTTSTSTTAATTACG